MGGEKRNKIYANMAPRSAVKRRKQKNRFYKRPKTGHWDIWGRLLMDKMYILGHIYIKGE